MIFFLIPGMTVPTLLFININFNATSAIEIPLGIKGRIISTFSTLEIKFSGTKYVDLQSSFGNLVSFVIFPVNVPSSNGTLAIIPTSYFLQLGNKLSSGD